jgi:lysylphosphatidylglycerol synthetase-like protein (DUF2156 family)
MRKSTAWTGWVLFAGVMLLVTGAVNVIEGLMALIQRERVVALAYRLYVIDLTGWGWTLLLFGLALVVVGFGLLAGQTWARVMAIIVVAVHAMVQVFWIGAYPAWSLLMIALDTAVLFGLTARWDTARDGLADDEDEYRVPDTQERVGGYRHPLS